MDYHKREMEISCCTTFGTLVKRDLKNTLRNPMLFKSRFIQSLVLGLYVGGVFFALGQDDYTNQNNWFAIEGFFFFMNISSMMTALAPVTLVFPA
jgi:hypothetical protein